MTYAIFNWNAKLLIDSSVCYILLLHLTHSSDANFIRIETPRENNLAFAAHLQPHFAAWRAQNETRKNLAFTGTHYPWNEVRRIRGSVRAIQKFFSQCRLNFQRSRRCGGWNLRPVCIRVCHLWFTHGMVGFLSVERKRQKGNSGGAAVKAKGESGLAKGTTEKYREKSRASREIHDVATVRRFALGCTWNQHAFSPL